MAQFSIEHSMTPIAVASLTDVTGVTTVSKYVVVGLENNYVVIRVTNESVVIILDKGEAQRLLDALKIAVETLS